jgi:hypothetical protein
MLTKIWTPTNLAAAPADENITSRTRRDKMSWVYGFNLSPFCVEILREDGGIEMVALPFAPFKHALAVQTEKLILHVSSGAMSRPAVFNDIDVDLTVGGAAQINNASIGGAAGSTTFITGFEITGAGATAASTIAVSVFNVLGGTKTYFLTIPAGAGVGLTPLIVEYARPIPAIGPGTVIQVSVPSFGPGNLFAAVTVHGFTRAQAPGATGAPLAPADLGFYIGFSEFEPDPIPGSW